MDISGGKNYKVSYQEFTFLLNLKTAFLFKDSMTVSMYEMAVIFRHILLYL